MHQHGWTKKISEVAMHHSLPKSARCRCAPESTLLPFIDVQQTRSAWRSVFFVTAAIYAFGTVFFAVFGSGDRQPWAVGKTVDEEVQLNVDDTTTTATHRVDKDEEETRN